MKIGLKRRQQATEKTIAKFKGQPFELGKADCAQVALFHLRAMGKKINKGKIPPYDNIRDAKKAVAEGFDNAKNLVDVMDGMFQRIAPAQCLIGDIIALPAHNDITGLGALSIYSGNGAVILFDETTEEMAMGHLTYEEGKEPIAAWRVTR